MYVSSYSLQEWNVHGAAWKGTRSILDSGGKMHLSLSSGVCLQRRHPVSWTGRNSNEPYCRVVCGVSPSLSSVPLQKYTMNFNQSTGIIEMFMDSLEVTDEGTFTFNLVDGKAKGTTSRVLIGDGKTYTSFSSGNRWDFHRPVTVSCCNIFFPLRGSRSLSLTIPFVLFWPMTILFPASCFILLWKKR